MWTLRGAQGTGWPDFHAIHDRPGSGTDTASKADSCRLLDIPSSSFPAAQVILSKCPGKQKQSACCRRTSDCFASQRLGHAVDATAATGKDVDLRIEDGEAVGAQLGVEILGVGRGEHGVVAQ